MYCPYCRSLFGEEDRFCRNCGAPLTAAQQLQTKPNGFGCAQPERPQQNGFGYAQPAQSTVRVQKRTKEYENIRQMVWAFCGSPAVEIFLIFLFLRIVMNLIYDFSWICALEEVCPILCCIGITAVYVQAKKKQASAAGVAILWGSVLAEMVLFLAAVLLFAVSIPFMVPSVFSGANPDAAGGFVLFCRNLFGGDVYKFLDALSAERWAEIIIGSVIGLAAVTVYFLCLQRGLKSTRLVLQGKTDHWKTSWYPAVILLLTVTICLFVWSSVTLFYTFVETWRSMFSSEHATEAIFSEWLTIFPYLGSLIVPAYGGTLLIVAAIKSKRWQNAHPAAAANEPGGQEELPDA